MGVCPLCRREQEGETCRVCAIALAPAPEATPPWALPRERAGSPARSAAATVAPPGREGIADLAAGLGDALRPIVEGETVRGNVIDVQGPERSEQWFDPWRGLCATLGFMLVLPVGAMLMCLGLAATMLLGILGLRTRGLSMGIFDLLLVRSLGGGGRQREPRVVFRYLLETAAGHQLVRQDGELVSGGIFRGNEVRIQGRRRGGMLVMTRGFNESLGCELAVRANPWMPLALMLALAVLVEYTWIFLALGVSL